MIKLEGALTNLLSGEILREKVFNLYAKYGNHIIGDILKELDEQYDKDIKDVAESKLNALLQHAVLTTEFYAGYKDKPLLSDFPVITKGCLKSNFESFISNSYRKSDFVVVQTSGSYGTPMKHLLNKEKRLRRAIEAIYYNTWANYKIGMKHILNSAGVTKSKCSQYMQNEIVFNLSRLQTNWLEDIRNKLRSKKVQFYIGYASALGELVEYCYAHNDQPDDYSILGMVAIGEALPGIYREKAEALFCCPVLSRYATLEFGVLAHECPEERNHHLNNTSYHIEILALDSDQSVPTGEMGRVIVTDLHSYGMPLLRYDTGDLAVLADGDCKCGRKGFYLERIEGRLLESLIAESGFRVSGFIIIQMMRYFDDIIEYRLIQEERNKFLLLLKVKNVFKDEEQIKSKLLEILGSDVELNLRYVETIPSLQSGKRPYVVNEYLQNMNEHQVKLN